MTKTIALACSLFAAQFLHGQSDSSKGLDEIVVTANRFPQKQVNTGKVMTVITRTQIEQSPFNTLGELLGRQTGVTIVGSGNAPGTNNDLYIRGSGTGHALILIDGNPAYDVSTIAATFDINFVPIGQIERIEILKGGQSTIYGSDAVSGVINIITRSNKNKKIAPSIHLSNGSFGTNTVDVTISGKTDLMKYKLQYLRTNSQGFSSAMDTNTVKTFDKDGFRQEFALAQVGSVTDSKWGWKAGAQWSKYNNDLDQSGFEDAKDYTVANQNLQFTAGLLRRIKWGTIQANINLNNSTRNYLDDSIHLNGYAKFTQLDYTGRSAFAEIFTTLRLAEGLQMFAGVDQRWQNTDQYYMSISDYGKYSTALGRDTANIRLSSFTTSIVYNSKKGFNLESGMRLNLHSLYGSNLTYTINPSYVLNNRIKIAFNLSSAFKAPTLYQLYDGAIGARNLKPETSVSSELSLQLLGINKISGRATLFNRNIKNGIDYDYENNKYFNNNKEISRGIELETGYSEKKWNVSLNYTYLVGNLSTTKFVYDENEGTYAAKGDTSFSHLFRIPAHSLNGTFGVQATKKVYLSIAQRFAGKRYEGMLDAAPVKLDPYHVTDLFAQYSINKTIKLYTSLKNVFNADYQEILGYTARGRNYVIGVRIGQ
jgi:vitamin B12 transporter